MITHDELVKLVHSAATEVFTTMLGFEPQLEPAYSNSRPSACSNGVISLIGIAGPLAGTGSISCTAQGACRIASQLMATEYDTVNDEVLDAVAEVTNMIIGNVKTGLEEVAGALGLSIPTVIYGRNFTSRTVGRQDWTIVPFVAGEERIEVQLCLAPDNRDAGRPELALAGTQFVNL